MSRCFVFTGTNKIDVFPWAMSLSSDLKKHASLQVPPEKKNKMIQVKVDLWKVPKYSNIPVQSGIPNFNPSSRR